MLFSAGNHSNDHEYHYNYNKNMEPKVLKLLSQFVSQAKKTKIEEVAKNRCQSVAVLLENINDYGNENAVARSMDAMGFQTLHSLRHGTNELNELKNKDSVRTDAGSKKWLTIHKWNNVSKCIQHIKERDFKIAVADSTAKMKYYDLDVTQKLVVGFGNELHGVTKELREASDISFSLPMYGFVDSYNLSVAVAITLFHIRTQLQHMKFHHATESHVINTQLTFYNKLLDVHVDFSQITNI